MRGFNYVEAFALGYAAVTDLPRVSGDLPFK
jgi:hypothetical protein